MERTTTSPSALPGICARWGYECVVGFCLPSDEAGDDDTTGDGDGDPSGDGDGDPSGDGDGDPSGDGDGDPSGDGDGDPSGDGDGEPGPFCGDGIVNGDEECDDGNNVDGDSCSNQCIYTIYWAAGPQLDVPEADLVGWTECWSGLYGVTYPKRDRHPRAELHGQQAAAGLPSSRREQLHAAGDG